MFKNHEKPPSLCKHQVIIKQHPLKAINVCTKFHDRDISVQTKAVQTEISQACLNMHIASLKLTHTMQCVGGV